MYRKVKEIIPASDEIEGAGVKLKRAFGNKDIPKLDPFLLFDYFDSKDHNDYIKGFPWHPHRGIETVTFLLSGEIEHRDSLGNKGVIGSGDCQWMSAGRGILHQEMPQISNHMLGFQLWVNLPRKEKMSEPKYRDIRSSEIPSWEDDGIIVKVIGGTYKGLKGGAKDVVGSPALLYVKIEEDAVFEIETDISYTSALFVLKGSGLYEPESEILDAKESTVIYGEGEKIQIKAKNGPLSFVYLSGRPLNEPIAWGGPIVMNTEYEVKAAREELYSEIKKIKN